MGKQFPNPNCIIKCLNIFFKSFHTFLKLLKLLSTLKHSILFINFYILIFFKNSYLSLFTQNSESGFNKKIVAI